MRTDTATFRRNAFKSIRRQGVNSVKSKRLVAMLAFQFMRRHHPVLADDARIVVSIDGEREQSVGVVTGGLVTLQLDHYTLRELQPLLDCTPTARQIEIGDLLAGMIDAHYSVTGDACQAYQAEFGYPTGDAGFDARDAYVKAFPAVATLHARYDALKAESLAINPNVDCTLVDPLKASFWYEWVKDFRGYRPSGFHTLAMVEADMERLATERPYDEDLPNAA